MYMYMYNVHALLFELMAEIVALCDGPFSQILSHICSQSSPGHQSLHILSVNVQCMAQVLHGCVMSTGLEILDAYGNTAGRWSTGKER